MALLIHKIWSENTRLKQVKSSGTVGIECTVKRDGALGKVSVIESSGNIRLDEAALTAAKMAPPLTNLPRKFKTAAFRVFFLHHLLSTPDRPACNSLVLSPYKRVGHNVRAPRATFAPDPEYSEEARSDNYQGSMQVGLSVSPDGKPAELCSEQGLGRGWDEKALAGGRNWTFDPGMEDGKPVPVRISVEVEFRLY